METVRGKLCKERKVKANRIRFLKKNCEEEHTTESNLNSSITIYDENTNISDTEIIDHNQLEVVVDVVEVDVDVDVDVDVEVDETNLCDNANAIGIDNSDENLEFKMKEEIIIEKDAEEEEETPYNSPFPEVKKLNDNECRNDQSNNSDMNNIDNNNFINNKEKSMNVISYLKQVRDKNYSDLILIFFIRILIQISFNFYSFINKFEY